MGIYDHILYFLFFKMYTERVCSKQYSGNFVETSQIQAEYGSSIVWTPYNMLL